MFANHQMKIRNQSGYTLLESILHLAVFMVFAQVLGGTMWWLTKTEETITDTTEIEWALFIQYVESYLNDLESITVNASNSGIVFKKNSINYKIEFYHNLIRKQKNGEGHEQMLFNVKSLFVKKDEDALRFKVKFLNSVEKEHIFYVTYRTE